MNCPMCIDQTLVAHHRAGIEIDMCPHCHGIWLDRGELERLALGPPAPSGAAANPAGLQDRPADRSRDRERDRDWDRDRDDDWPKSKKKKKKKKNKSLGYRLADALDDLIDL
ncbi:MAG: zf-TFIIB domain-containing protein [Actinomycetota bacterium]